MAHEGIGGPPRTNGAIHVVGGWLPRVVGWTCRVSCPEVNLEDRTPCHAPQPTHPGLHLTTQPLACMPCMPGRGATKPSTCTSSSRPTNALNTSQGHRLGCWEVAVGSPGVAALPPVPC